MKEMQEIREAMLRLSCIECIPCQYDPVGQEVGEGPIHYLIELSNLFFIAWENSETGTMVINPITRFDLDELDELGAIEAWTILRLPNDPLKGIQFREIDNVELSKAYSQMTGRASMALAPPLMQAH
jgi:hypothetical protein